MMKKKIFAITVALTMAAAPAMAQVFLDDEDYNKNRQGSSELQVELPGIYNSGEDWYAPIGEGVVLLAGLAGAYLIGKRRKED